MDLKQIPLSLYIHLPCCEKKCPYCDFNVTTNKIDEDEDENYNRNDDYEDDDDDVQEVKEASFEEAFAAELESVHGDLGPESNRNRGRKRKGR